MARQFYRRIFSETDEVKQLELIVEACEVHENTLPSFNAELKPPSGRIEAVASRLPGIAADSYATLQDLEIILQHITNMEDKRLMEKAKYYSENYQRTLSDRMAEKYADVHDTVYEIRQIRFRVAGVRNQFLAISKGLEYMHFQISNVVKLRCAGLDDSTF